MGKLLVLDGGLGHLLKHCGVRVPNLPYDQQFLAGTLANETDPATVLKAHRAYIATGCQCITTNNFVATKYSLSKVQRRADAIKLSQLAGQLARQAVTASGLPVMVAGSLPPLQESYQTTNLPSAAELQEEYHAIATALCSYVDVFLAETLSTVAEAQAALAATAPLGKPIWVSFTLEDSARCCLRSGEPLTEALQAVQSHFHFVAVLVNCCAPGAAAAAIPVLKQHVPPGILVGCYANGFQTTTSKWLSGTSDLLPIKQDDYDADGLITPEAYLMHAKQWRAAGADIIGGCCGVGPQHMKLLAEWAAASI